MQPNHPRVEADWAWRGQPVTVLENARVRAVVLPGLGGKIISLIDKRADCELLWRNERVPVRPVPFGSGYDDQFLGGWDELYPNDEPETLAGEPYPDHGEVWSLPWDATTGSTDGTAWLELSLRTPISGSMITKRLTLGGGSELLVDYRVINSTRTDLPYLWKSHVAVALQPDTMIELGAREVLVHEFGLPRARPAGGRTGWPYLEADGVRHDLRTLPDTRERGVSEFLIATDLHRGSCGVTHPGARTGLQLAWDVAELPSCWLFASYGGGWRDLDVLVLEPCTGHPLSVTEGVAAGTHRVLPAGATVEWQLTATIVAGPSPSED